MLLDDIKVDERFIKMWKEQLEQTKDKEKVEALRHQIKTIKKHLARRKDALKEFQ
mgnify:CR=1 FL=1